MLLGGELKVFVPFFTPHYKIDVHTTKREEESGAKLDQEVRLITKNTKISWANLLVCLPCNCSLELFSAVTHFQISAITDIVYNKSQKKHAYILSCNKLYPTLKEQELCCKDSIYSKHILENMSRRHIIVFSRLRWIQYARRRHMSTETNAYQLSSYSPYHRPEQPMR